MASDVEWVQLVLCEALLQGINLGLTCAAALQKTTPRSETNVRGLDAYSG
jgi:hypothetical protein